MKILDRITDYHDLSGLGYESLEQLAFEIREKIVEVVSVNGGHLGSPLGAVELSIALLRQLDPEQDRIIFDVGHQCYPYKLLTGRKDRFSSLRQQNGISGYPKRTESIYDHFDTGHSSTSISAALGFAKARDLKKQSHEVVAVIGDGALLNGLAFEAMNYCKESNGKIIIILNDNHMCISPRVGGFATYLARLSSNYTYRNLKKLVKSTSYKLPKGKSVESFLRKSKEKIKSLVKPENIFDEMGLNYWGPFDGHNIKEVEEVLKLAKKYDKPVIIHLLTQKGKGHSEAEKNPPIYHGISPYSSTVSGKSWSEAAANAVEKLAEKDPYLVCLTAAMKEGNKLGSFADHFPDRFIDVGIAEEHMLTMSAGLAAAGMHPVVFIYSTFLQRAMDQLVHDIAMQNLPVTIAVDRAGLVGEDGETHQGVLDIAWGKSIPNLEIMAPRDIVDLDMMIRYAHDRKGPTMIRFPRGPVPEEIARDKTSLKSFDSCCEILREGEEWVLFGIGKTVKLLLDAGDLAKEKGLPSPTIVDIRSIKPIDKKNTEILLKRHKIAITAEDGFISGGVGHTISNIAQSSSIHTLVLNQGIPDLFISQGTMSQQWEECGLTAHNIVRMFEKHVQKKA